MNSDTFKERLKLTIGDYSIRAFADMCEISEGTIRRYLRAETYPPIDTLEKMSEAGGVSFSWLATGEGQARGEAKGHGSVNDGLEAYSECRSLPPWQLSLAKFLDNLVAEEVDRRKKTSAAEPPDPQLRDLKWWLDDFWKKNDQEQRSWLIVEIKRHFPEFTDWLKEREKSRLAIDKWMEEGKNGPPWF